MTQPKNPLASRLAARVLLTVQADGMWWRVRVLTPAEAAGMGAAMALIHPPVQRADPEAPQPDMDLQALPRMMEFLQDSVCLSVQEGSQDGVDWYPIRLVTRLDQQDPEAGRVFIGCLSPQAVTTLATKAGSAFLEARKEAARFPGPSRPPPIPGQGSQEVGG